MSKGGRPRIDIDVDEVERLAARGLSEAQIADALGIHWETLASRKKQFSEFSDALKKGKAKGIGYVAGKLLDQIEEGEVAATIFFLKTRAGWKETQVNEHQGKDGGPIESKQEVSLPPVISPEEWLKAHGLGTAERPAK